MARKMHPNSLANLKHTGRTRGRKNYLGLSEREYLADVLSQNRGEFVERLKKLPDDKFCLIYLKMIDLILPKIQESPEVAKQILFKISGVGPGADEPQNVDFEELKQDGQ